MPYIMWSAGDNRRYVYREKASIRTRKNLYFPTLLLFTIGVKFRPSACSFDRRHLYVCEELPSHNSTPIVTSFNYFNCPFLLLDYNIKSLEYVDHLLQLPIENIFF